MPSKYKTIVIDSGGELARLYFTKSMNKSSDDTEKIRQVNDYPPATERLNMLIRRFKNLRDAGCEIVFNCHEDIQKTYARGGAIAARGQQAAEPIEVKGQPDFPGNSTPNEMMRAADNVLRVRTVNKVPTLIANKELLASGSDYWVAKDRFFGESIGQPAGYLPFDYEKIKALVLAKNPKLWNPAYIWIFYGLPGIGKSRKVVLTFPRPMKVFDLDRGLKSLAAEDLTDVDIESYDVEDVREYDRFVGSVGKLF